MREAKLNQDRVSGRKFFALLVSMQIRTISKLISVSQSFNLSTLRLQRRLGGVRKLGPPDSMAADPVSVLFVCLGNICRSTMAEGIFRSMVSKPPYHSLISEVDSCGTGAYHTGSSPDSRTMSTLEDNGIVGYEHAARKIHTSDFHHFDYIFAMDRDNLRDLQRIHRRTGGKARVMLFGEFAGQTKAEEIDDPYYGARDGFEEAYEKCVRFSKNFLYATFPEAQV